MSDNDSAGVRDRDFESGPSFVTDDEVVTLDGGDGTKIQHRLVYLRDTGPRTIQDLRLNALHQAAQLHANAVYRYTVRDDDEDEPLTRAQEFDRRTQEILDTAEAFEDYMLNGRASV